MFSCVLLRCGDKQEDSSVLLAEKATVNVQVVSSVGKGVAVLEYAVQKNKDLVLCIPCSISSKNGCFQEVKVTGCHFDIENEGRTTLHLAKQDEYPVQAKNIPSFSSIRKGLTNSIASNDTVIYLGSFNSCVKIQIEFHLRIFHNTSPHHVLDSNVLAKKLTYTLNYASHTKILDVAHSSSVFEQLNWKYRDDSCQMVSVQYSTVSDFLEMDEVPSVTIKLSTQEISPSVCCVCLKRSWSSSDLLVNGTKKDNLVPDHLDGLMVACSRVTPDALAAVTTRNSTLRGTCMNQTTPPEVVFLVDCSASMSPFIETVSSTLMTCLKSLPQGCYFNLISFGSSFRHLYPKSVDYSSANVRHSVDYAYSKLKANLGGTELLPPLQWVFKNARKNNVPCQIFIITDADHEVKDVPHILNTIKKNRHYSRLVPLSFLFVIAVMLFCYYWKKRFLS